jgi:hypothetical protein
MGRPGRVPGDLRLFIRRTARKGVRRGSRCGATRVVARPRWASAQTVVAKIKLYFLHDRAGARREYDISLQLAPNDPEVLHSRSHYWLAMGRPDLVEEEGTRGLRIDPLNMMFGPHQAWVPLMTGQYDEAIRRANSILQFNSMHKPTLGYLVAAYEEAGQNTAGHRSTAETRPSGSHDCGSSGSGGISGSRRVLPNTGRLFRAYAAQADSRSPSP